MKITNNILPFILWLSLLLTAGGCDSRVGEPEIEDPAGRAPKIFVTFNVALQKTPAATRAKGASESSRAGEGDLKTWADTPLDRENGDDFDNRILQNNFSAILYKNDNSLAGTIKQIAYTRSQETYSEYILTFTGLLDTELTDKDFKESQENAFKIMIFANIPEAFDGTSSETEATRADVEDHPAAKLLFTHEGKAGEGSFNAIPMWGVEALDMRNLTSVESYDPDKVNRLGTVHLLRAMAMVRVRFHDDVANKGAELLSITLNRHNLSGYTLPSKWHETLHTSTLRLDETLREKRDDSQSGPMSVEVSAGDNPEGIYEGKKLSEKVGMQFYLPEIANYKPSSQADTDADGETDADKELTLTVKYRYNGKDREGTIKFRNYENGVPKDGEDPYDIVRNHIYEFIITQISPDGIELNAAVRDWRIIRYEYYY